MEPAPSKSKDSETRNEQGELTYPPPEVTAMMKKAVWPEPEMADLVYNSLLKRPVILWETRNVTKILDKEFIYRDGAVVAEKTRENLNKTGNNSNKDDGYEVDADEDSLLSPTFE